MNKFYLAVLILLSLALPALAQDAPILGGFGFELGQVVTESELTFEKKYVETYGGISYGGVTPPIPSRFFDRYTIEVSAATMEIYHISGSKREYQSQELLEADARALIQVLVDKYGPGDPDAEDLGYRYEQDARSIYLSTDTDLGFLALFYNDHDGMRAAREAHQAKQKANDQDAL